MNQDNDKGKILEAYSPKWAYTVKAHCHQHDDGAFTLSLTYADGTPLSKDDACEFMIGLGVLPK